VARRIAKSPRREALSSQVAVPPEPVLSAVARTPARVERKPPRVELKRRRLRADLWPGTTNLHYNRKTEVGFTTIPRTLPLLCALIKAITPKGEGDASRAYLDLWGRAYDEGYVDIVDEAEMALACGYAHTNRLVRTWRERMGQLEELGFISVRPKPTRHFGYVLLLHPHDVVERLRRDREDLIPDSWWQSYEIRRNEIGARRRVLDDLEGEMGALREMTQDRGVKRSEPSFGG
jgi:hypothetical protein